jgi:release factor glutamine methyltransferase
MSTTPATWTILALLRWTTGYFEEKGVSEPRASAEILLAHTLGLSRLDLYLRHDQPLTPEELARFKALILRRRLGEPVAYLTGHKEFWSLDFFVTPATLIPRPETEVLVEAVLEVCGAGGQGSKTPAPSPTPPPPTPNFGSPGFQPVQHRQDAGAPTQRGLGGEFEGSAGDWPSPGPPLKSSLAIDIGVGSGAVVVALATELPELHWVGVDVSAAALRVARENARRHGGAERIAFVQGDLLSGIRPGPRFALMVANLPYVSRAEWEQLPGEIRDYEPPEALLGGEDGLDLIRSLSRQAHDFLEPHGWLALEMGAGQARRVTELLEEAKAYDILKAVPDYQGIPRVVLARRRGAA